MWRRRIKERVTGASVLGALTLTTAMAGCRAAPSRQAVAVDLAPSGSDITVDRNTAVAAVPSAVTPGLVPCGRDGARCDIATELCCNNPAKGTGECMARSAGAASAEDECWKTGRYPVTLTCDEASDCPQGQACCIQDLASGEPSAYRSECAPLPCNVAEICVPGAPCAGRGRVCRQDAETGEAGGRCALESPGSACGDRRCEGTSPVCCWDVARATGRCVGDATECLQPDAQGTATAEAVVLECSSGEDCGGYPCAHSGVSVPGVIYACTSRWAAGDMGFTILCRTARDCPEYPGRARRGCERNPELPPWVSTCVYDWPE